jgi:hypothetical protein
MPWMPADSEATAEQVSAAVYHLTRGHAHGLPGDTDVTQYAFAWRTAQDGSTWMRWDGDTVLPVHPDHGDDLADLLTGFASAGQLAQASADAIIALAAERQAEEGGTVTLSEVTPPEWQTLLLTDEQAEPLWPAPENLSTE